MRTNYTFRDVTEALPKLLRDLEYAPEVGSRQGSRTKELTMVGITLAEPLNREILLDHRKPSLAAQIAETAWVLAGRSDIEWLENYLPRVKQFSDDGETWRAGYGQRLRNWGGYYDGRTKSGQPSFDQLAWLVEHLKESPSSRRAVMSIWDPAVDSQPGEDIPCNDWLSFLCRDGKLDLHVAIRSNDAIWGWSGINQFEWSVLLEVVAGMCGFAVGSLHFSTTSFHLYDHHWDKAHKISELTPPPIHLEPSPRFEAGNRSMAYLDQLLAHWFQIEYDIRTGSPLVQGYVDKFPEPMLQSWLRILQWHWSKGVRKDEYLEPLKGTRLELATHYSTQPPRKPSGVDYGLVRGEATQLAAKLITLGKSGIVRAELEKINRERVGVIPDEEVVEFRDRMLQYVSSTEKVADPAPSFAEHSDAPVKGHWAQEADLSADLAEAYGDDKNAALHRQEARDLRAADEQDITEFAAFVRDLHIEKDASYGPSWKKRGELFSIVPNIARKIDRLGEAETRDETSADTAIDLLVYLAKYHTWLHELDCPSQTCEVSSDDPLVANEIIFQTERRVCEPDGTYKSPPEDEEIAGLRSMFDELEAVVTAQHEDRIEVVKQMLPSAYRLARTLWDREEMLRGYRGADVD